MKMEALPVTARPLPSTRADRRASSPWRADIAAWTALAAWTVLAYWGTVRAIVMTWRSSDTYAHGYLVLPVCAWLVWRDRSRLAALTPCRDWSAVPLLALPGAAWLLGELAQVRVVQEFALVSMVPVLVWALLGRPVVRALAFPLAFLYFAVPFGDFMLPWLMEHTADFTAFALRASGVPVYRDGMQLTVPTGSWSVVEACGGLRYLTACFTGGVLYAYLRYRSLGRRLCFIAAAAVVPIVANWLRAYLIVMIAQWSDGRIAANVDHVLYGWVFFALVTLLLFAAGSVWREDGVAARAVFDRPQPSPPGSPSRAALVAVATASALTLALWPLVALRLDAAPAELAAPLVAPAVAGWQMRGEPPGAWRPAVPARATAEQAYARDGKVVTLHLAYYRDERRGPELVNSLNRLAPADGPWTVVSEGARRVDAGNARLSPVVTEVRRGSQRFLVWRWYWVDGALTSSAYLAKALQLRSRLRGHGDDGALVMLYAPSDRNAARVLGEFAADALPAITRTLEHVR